MPSSKLSVAELRALGQPPGLLARRNAEHWAGLLYMRRVSPYVTFALLRTGLSANAVTFLMMLVGAAGAYSFKYGTLFGAVVGALLVQLYLLLDCSDGEMARVTGTTGATGIFLDRLGHFVVEAGIIVTVSIPAAHHVCTMDLCPGIILPPDRGWIMLGTLAALIHVLAKLLTDLVEAARAKAGMPPLNDDQDTARPRGGVLATLRSVAGLIPAHRMLLSIEASLIVLGAQISDSMRNDHTATRVVVVTFLVAAIYEFVGHLVGILASNRLRA